MNLGQAAAVVRDELGEEIGLTPRPLTTQENVEEGEKRTLKIEGRAQRRKERRVCGRWRRGADGELCGGAAEERIHCGRGEAEAEIKCGGCCGDFDEAGGRGSAAWDGEDRYCGSWSKNREVTADSIAFSS